MYYVIRSVMPTPTDTNNLSISDMATLSTVVAIVVDLWVLIVTWKKTADIWKFSLKNHHFKPALSTLLIRDGKMEHSPLFLPSLFLPIDI